MAKDVCDFLGFRDTNDGTKRLDPEEKQVVQINPTNSRGNPNKVIINESGLYSLILRSRKPEAKAFKKWVTSEVLPSIRKTGKYQLDMPLPEKMETLCKAYLEEREKVKQLEPKAEAFDAFIIKISS